MKEIQTAWWWWAENNGGITEEMKEKTGKTKGKNERNKAREGDGPRNERKRENKSNNLFYSILLRW